MCIAYSSSSSLEWHCPLCASFMGKTFEGAWSRLQKLSNGPLLLNEFWQHFGHRFGQILSNIETVLYCRNYNDPFEGLNRSILFLVLMRISAVFGLILIDSSSWPAIVEPVTSSVSLFSLELPLTLLIHQFIVLTSSAHFL